MEEFLSAEFTSAVEWLNEKLKLGDDSTALHAGSNIASLKQQEILPIYSSQLKASASDLLLNLQVLSDDVATETDRIASDFAANIPRMVHELKVLEQEASQLFSVIERVKSSIQLAVESPAQPNDTNSFHQLVRFDRAKSRMEETLTALKEAEKWSTLSQEMETILQSGNFVQASNRLFEAQNSLSMFKESAEYEGKRAQLSMLQSKLEEILNPLLLNELNNQDLDSIKSFYQIYCKIDRSNVFFQLYQKSRKQHIQQLWQKLDTVESNLDLVKEFRHFFEETYLVLSRENSWLSQFTDGTSGHLKSLIESVFASLQPSMETRLKSFRINSKNSEYFLPNLIEIYHSAQIFANWMGKLLPSNHQLYNNIDGFANQKSLEGWSRSLFQPFISYQSAFKDLERQYLSEKIRQFFSFDAGSIGIEQTAAKLAVVISQSFLASKDSLSRCRQLTRGYGIFDLISCLNLFYRADILTKLQSIIGVLDQLVKSPRMNERLRKQQRKNRNFDDALDSIELEADDGDVFSNDFINFTASIKILTSIYSFHKKLEIFEKQLRQEVIGYQDLLTRKTTVGTEKSSEELDEETLIRNFGASAALEQLRVAFNNYPNYQKSYETIMSEKNLFGAIAVDFKDLYKKTQTLVLDSLVCPLISQLSLIRTLEVWQAARNPGQVDGAYIGLDIKGFSLSPGTYIYRVGESLLMMPRLFDVGYNCETAENSVAMSADVDAALAFMIDELVADKTEMDSEMIVVQAWIRKIALLTLDYYINEQVLKIPTGSLTIHGAQQLLTDIDYFWNILMALGIADTTNGATPIKNLQVLRALLQFVTQQSVPLPEIGAELKALWQRLSKQETAIEPPNNDPMIQEIFRLLDKSDGGKRVFIQTLRLFKGLTLDF